MEVISKEEARQAGQLYYCTGKPCKRGNIGPRLVSNGACRCEDCKVEGKKAVKRWYDADPERLKVKERLRYQRHKEKLKIKDKKFREENPDYYPNYYLRNKERYNENAKRHYENNKEWYFSRTLKRNKRKKEATPLWAKQEDFNELIELRDQMRDATGFDWDIDHIIPLNARKASGLNCKENLQIIPSVLNRNKGNKMIYSEPYSWLEDFNAVLYCPVMESKSRDGKQFN